MKPKTNASQFLRGVALLWMFFSSFSLFDLLKGGNFKMIFSLFRTLSYLTLVHKKNKVCCKLWHCSLYLFSKLWVVHSLYDNKTSTNKCYSFTVHTYYCCILLLSRHKTEGARINKNWHLGSHIICPQNLKINTFRFQKWDWLYIVLIYTDKRPKLEGYLTPHYRCVVSKIE